MKALVVGGAGFIGSHLVERLVAEDAIVDVVDDYSTGTLANLAEARRLGGRLKIHHLHAASDEARTLIGMKQPDVVYHLAALPTAAPSAVDAAASFADTVALLEAARDCRVQKIVVALPATSLYGHPDRRDLPLKEVPLEPRGVVGIMARATVDLLHLHREQAAVEFTALALSDVYGPRQSAGVVADYLAAAQAGEPVIIRGDGRETRDLLFIDDAVDALFRAGERGSGLVINIGTGEQIQLAELWSLIAGEDIAPVYQAASPDELGRFAVSPVRARIHLGWSPWTPLDVGLRAARVADDLR